MRAITFDQRKNLSVVGFGHVVGGGGNLGEVGVGPLKCTVDCGRCGLEKLGYFGGAELRDVAKDQHGSLTRR